MSRSRSLVRSVVPALALASAGAGADAQPVRKDAPSRTASETAAFVARLGADTILVERFTRSGSRIEGEAVTRTPAVQIVHYIATLGADDRITELEFHTRGADGVQPRHLPQAVVLRVVGDSVRREARYADSTAVRTVAVPASAFLSYGTSYALYEHAVRRLRASGQTTGTLQMYGGGPRAGASLPVTLAGTDSAHVEYFGDPVALAFDRAGRLLTWDGSRSTNKVIVRRVPDADVQALATAFAARPAMGQTSPRDTARAPGADEIFVDYGRPSVRGRTVWGGQLVPYGAIWRTGANQATHLRTARDLVIGGTPVPAGTYTLYTWPTAQGSQLVISRQTGQWGTEYSQAQDLARIPLTATTLASPVEQFTIAIDRAGNGGTLRMMWDRTQLAVPFTVR